MVILGLDPGIARCGFGVISTPPLELVTYGCLTSPASDAVPLRLRQLGEGLAAVLEQHQPDLAMVERVFFGANAKAAMVTAEVGGMLAYVLAKYDVAVEVVTPPQVKRELTGSQKAGKGEVEAAVRDRLKLSEEITPDDAADALAMALCGVS